MLILLSRFICSSNNNITRITKMVKSLCTQYSPSLLSLPPPIPTATRMPTPFESDGNSSRSATPEPEPESYHPFPPPSHLSSPDVVATLRSLGFGYRADFIQKTAKMLEDAYGVGPSSEGKEGPERWLYTLRNMTTVDARQELLKFMGVGRKVADCVLLMSLDKVSHRMRLPFLRSNLSGQPEVIPVDTHVHQIAMKHYGFRGTSGTKQTMSPKLYDAISENFHDIWGDHAGWAHSVRLLYYMGECADYGLQVLFTAELKAFSDYGLLTPSPSPSKAATISRGPEDYFSAKAHPQRKRRAKEIRSRDALEQGSASCTDTSPAESSSLAERVKKRRRR